MHIQIEKCKVFDYLDVFISTEQKKISEDIFDDNLMNVIKYVESENLNQYMLIFDTLKQRELLKANLKQIPESEQKELSEIQFLEKIFREEFVNESSLGVMKSTFRGTPAKNLICILDEILTSMKNISDGFERKVQNNELKPSDFLSIFTMNINNSIMFMVINVEVTKKMIVDYKEWKFSPELQAKFRNLSTDSNPGLRELGLLTTSDPQTFFKCYYNQDKFIGLQYLNQIENPTLVDLVHTHFMLKKTVDASIAEYKNEERLKDKNGKGEENSHGVNNYIIYLSLIESLFIKCEVIFGDSEEIWWKRFINTEIEPSLNKPIGIERNGKKGNNLHFLIAVLSEIENINKSNKDFANKRVVDFEKYVLNRWGIKDYYGKKSVYLNKYGKHPKTKEIIEMITKEQKSKY